MDSEISGSSSVTWKKYAIKLYLPCILNFLKIHIHIHAQKILDNHRSQRSHIIKKPEMSKDSNDLGNSQKSFKIAYN